MRSFSIVLSPSIAAPVLINVLIFVLAVIGHVIPYFSYTSMPTNVTYRFFLWVWNTTPNSGSTAVRMWGWMTDYSNNLCSYNWQLWKGSMAWAIITAILAGLAVIVCLFSLILQQQITVSKGALSGIILSALIFVSSWITFSLMIANTFKSCNNMTLRGFDSYELGPAAFMYLGTAILSAITFICNLKTLQASRTPRPEPITAAKAQTYGSPKAPESNNSNNSGIMTRVVVQQNQSPVRHELPLPEGSDWILDESGLYWSETKKLFFDRASGQFYDPSSDKWYNPEQNIWYKL